MLKKHIETIKSICYTDIGSRNLALYMLANTKKRKHTIYAIVNIYRLAV